MMNLLFKNKEQEMYEGNMTTGRNTGTSYEIKV